ncbi:asparagine synthase (glutamine-hydrolyzing) [Bradyrhizobium sp. USDA 4523]
MCGIAGFLADPSSRTSVEQLKSIADAMDVSLEHRGPDDHGIWVDAEAGVALVHRRLSIVDLSPAGHQPMHSADGRFVMVYNGEVYSHLPIRAEIEATGHRFRGHSDTEVLLESFARYGIRATADRLIGMFAIAIWDRQERTLKLIRDRLGIKPIYWAKVGGLFMFGSELKALRRHPGWTPRIEPAAVASFMRHNYIPAPHTIYRDVYKLEPGDYSDPGIRPRTTN